MGLLTDVKAGAQSVGATTVVVDTKKEAKKEKKEAKRNALAVLIAFAKEHGDEKAKKAAELLTAKRTGGFGGEDIFAKVFGKDAKIGDKVTALEMFERSDKSIKQFVKKCADWKEKGRYDVEYNADAKTFTVKAIY